MAGPLDWLGGIPGQLLWGGLGAIMQGGAYEQARASNLRRYDESNELQRIAGRRLAGEYHGLAQQAQAGYAGLGKDASRFYGQQQAAIPTQYERLRQQGQYGPQGIQQLRGDVLGGYGRAQEASGRGYGQRYKTGMGMLSGSGETERGDIRQRYGDLAGQQQAELMARGMAGTNIGGNLAAQRTRDMTREYGALDERLRQQQLGWHSQLSGEHLAAQDQWAQQGLGARERIGTMGYGQAQAIRQAQLQREHDVAQQGYGAQQGYREQGLLGGLGYREAGERARFQSRQNLINQIIGRQDPYPEQTAYPQMMSNLAQLYAAKQQPEAERGYGGLGGAIGTGAGLGLGLLVPGLGPYAGSMLGGSMGYGIGGSF